MEVATMVLLNAIPHGLRISLPNARQILHLAVYIICQSLKKRARVDWCKEMFNKYNRVVSNLCVREEETT